MNERAVGKGIQRAIDEGYLTRDELFVTTKLWVSEYTRVDESLNETHPYFHDLAMKEHIAPYGTVFEAWFPLGGRTETQSQLFHDETILTTFLFTESR